VSTVTGVNEGAAIADGLFTIEDGVPHLIGSQCAGCSTRYFPQAAGCRNPHCDDKRIASALLPSTGTLVSYTVQRYQPPPLFRMDNWSPYAIGLVDLGEGVEVMGMLTQVDPAAIQIGMPVRLVLEALFEDPERGPILTYKFAPAEEAA
jgi:uncharacterized OB-fold protein